MIFKMGSNIIAGIPRIVSPRGGKREWDVKKIQQEKRDFTRSRKGSFLRRKRRVIHWGFRKRKIVGIKKWENRRKAKFYLQGLPALVLEKVIAVGIKCLVG